MENVNRRGGTREVDRANNRICLQRELSRTEMQVGVRVQIPRTISCTKDARGFVHCGEGKQRGRGEGGGRRKLKPLLGSDNRHACRSLIEASLRC